MKLQKVLVGFIGIVISVVIGVGSASAQVTCWSGSVNEVSIIPVLRERNNKQVCRQNSL